MTAVFSLLFFLLSLIKPVIIRAEASSDIVINSPQVLLINQVRGAEGYEPGKLEVFQNQLKFLQEKELPAIFTLRYDVLTNQAYQKVITEAETKLFTWGIFLEITPQLAEAAGVEYRAQAENWYEAQHAYTLGYKQTEREKLIDTLMAAYKQLFGFYPAVTTSWIIDTPTLNYLQTKYGVEVHQLTREQWGTDSYTLYGGPPHYPYPASRNWALLPDFGGNHGPFIVRQTLTDPVWNYGDSESRFTSQPNDFTQEGKDFSYFEKLLKQALFEQPAGQRGFALLGLENSMKTKYQALYQRQLELVAQLVEQDKITLPDLKQLQHTWFQTGVKVYGGQDFVKQTQTTAYWLRTGRYRLRLLQKGSTLMIDDLRLYDPSLTDYYLNHQAQARSYWITPFLLDGSRFYTQEKTWFKPKKFSSGQDSQPDVLTQPQAWLLPSLSQGKLRFERQGQSLKLGYESEQGWIELVLEPTRFGVSKSVEAPPRLRWQLEQKTVYELQNYCDQWHCWYQPRVNSALFSQAQQVQRYAFLPEQQIGEISSQNSRLYADNPYAIAGRNPVRLVFIPRDENGVAVQLAEPPQIKLDSSQVKLETEPASVIATHPQFYDLTSQTATKTAVMFQVGDQLKLKTQLYFAPNCKQAWFDCVRQPQKLWWYVRSWLGDKRRLISKRWDL